MRTLEWDDKKRVLKLIDQTQLPEDYKIVEYANVPELIDAIKSLKVRGAPALGVAGAFGVVLACTGMDKHEFKNVVEELAAARPTAVNLCYGVNRTRQAARCSGKACRR